MGNAEEVQRNLYRGKANKPRSASRVTCVVPGREHACPARLSHRLRRHCRRRILVRVEELLWNFKGPELVDPCEDFVVLHSREARGSNLGLCRAVCLSEMVGDARMCNYEGDYTSAAKVVMTVGSYKLCTIATFSVRRLRCTRRPCLGGLDLRSSGTDCGVRPGRGAGEARGGTLLACG
jgi:hypothetical protein